MRSKELTQIKKTIEKEMLTIISDNIIIKTIINISLILFYLWILLGSLKPTYQIRFFLLALFSRSFDI
jgi:hypothetical protein